MSPSFRVARSAIAALALLALTPVVRAGQPTHPPVRLFLEAGGSDNAAAAFWVWTLIALGVTATFCVILAAHRLWSSRGQSR